LKKRTVDISVWVNGTSGHKLMKLFKTSNINLINDSQYYFNFELPSELLMKRKDTFIENRVFWITLPFSN